ncbi:hypothetical protein FRC02_008361 [Tulasnella sp. 418]|nr:hypothetical protein FRC02_008361 [Tulasnella sp. 418]
MDDCQYPQPETTWLSPTFGAAGEALVRPENLVACKWNRLLVSLITLSSNAIPEFSTSLKSPIAKPKERSRSRLLYSVPDDPFLPPALFSNTLPDLRPIPQVAPSIREDNRGSRVIFKLADKVPVACIRITGACHWFWGSNMAFLDEGWEKADTL